MQSSLSFGHTIYSTTFVLCCEAYTRLENPWHAHKSAENIGMMACACSNSLVSSRVVMQSDSPKTAGYTRKHAACLLGSILLQKRCCHTGKMVPCDCTRCDIVHALKDDHVFSRQTSAISAVLVRLTLANFPPSKCVPECMLLRYGGNIIPHLFPSHQSKSLALAMLVSISTMLSTWMHILQHAHRAKLHVCV